MNNLYKFLGVIAIGAVISIGLAGCENSSGGDGNPTVASVTVSPATATVVKGGTQQFTATVSGANDPAQTVTWAVEGGGAGTAISASGLLSVAATESDTTITVRATSIVDISKSGTATVTVTGTGSLDATIY